MTFDFDQLQFSKQELSVAPWIIQYQSTGDWLITFFGKNWAKMNHTRCAFIMAVWHFPRTCLLKNMFLEIPRKITGVLYEQNKLNETIQRHKSDTVVNPMSLDKILIDIWFISIVEVAQLVPTIVSAWSKIVFWSVDRGFRPQYQLEYRSMIIGELLVLSSFGRVRSQ